jgi:hypothetical protein
MAKEIFKRDKPHVNIGDRVKGFFGIGKGPEEPPIEPYEEETPGGDTTADGFHGVDGLSAEIEVVEHREGGPGPGDVLGSGETEPAAFNPTEYSIDKQIKWNEGGEPDTTPGNDFRMMKSRQGHSLNEDEAGDADELADAEPDAVDELGRVKVKFPSLPEEPEETSGAAVDEMVQDDLDAFGGPKGIPMPVPSRIDTGKPAGEAATYEVETDAEGEQAVRFGDGEHGRVPDAGEGSPGGGGANEIRMGDSAGAEGPPGGPVPMPYPMTQDSLDPDASVDKDEKITIHGNRTENSAVGGSQTETVGSDETEDVGDGAAYDVDSRIVGKAFKVEINSQAPESEPDELATSPEFEQGKIDLDASLEIVEPFVYSDSEEETAADAGAPSQDLDHVGNFNFKVEIEGVTTAMQHNETDLEFLAERGAEGGDSGATEIPHTQGNFLLHLDGQGDADPDAPIIAGNVPNPQSPAAGSDGSEGNPFIPEVEDEVVVEFEQGDLNQPHVIGGMWNGKDAPPEEAPPSGLPGGETISGLRSSTTPGAPGGSGHIDLWDGSHSAQGEEEDSLLVSLEPDGATKPFEEAESGEDVDLDDADELEPDLDV